MKISIIIPNYNGERFIYNCIKSLNLQSHKAFEIIVVDNCSHDLSVKIIEDNFKDVKIISLDKNYGFSYAVNVGIKSSVGDFVLLINNDTEAEKDFVKNILNCIKADDKIFSVTAKMIRYNERNKIDDAGDFYNILGWSYKRGDGESILKYKNNSFVFSCCGGAAIFRKKLFERVGLFDESFFAYMEDLDICYRAKILGYKNLYCSNAKIYHIGSGTSGSKYNNFKISLSARNNIFVIYKNMPYFQILLNLPFLIVGFLIKILFFYKIGFGEIYLKGLKDGFLGLKKVKKVVFSVYNLKNYVKIEIELIINLFRYIFYKLRIKN